MQAFHAAYAQQRERWITEDKVKPEQLANLDRWIKEANNASFGAQGAYDDLVPAFLALFEQQGKDWTKFHATVKQLSNEPKDKRHAALNELMKTTSDTQTAASEEKTRP